MKTRRSAGWAVSPRGATSARVIALWHCAIGLLLGSLLASTATAETGGAPAAAPPLVVVAKAATPPGENLLVLPGTIEAWQETLIYARTDGYVRRWHVDIGERVAAGQLLVEIDAPEVDQALAQARAAVAQAEANLEIARTTYQRWKTLVDSKTVSAQDLDERRATHEARKADLIAAQANVQRLEELQRFERVTAPFAGVVTLRNVEHGALIGSGSDGTARELYRVAETERLKLRVRVPQAHLRAMVPGLGAEVLVAEFPERHFTGKVVRTAGAIDPGSRTLLTEVELPNADGALLPGLYAQIKFALPHDPGIVLVPTNAVRIDGAGAHIATVDAANAVRLQRVTLGRNLGTQVEVLSGLAVDSAVILNPTDELQDGVVVQVKAAQGS